MISVQDFVIKTTLLFFSLFLSDFYLEVGKLKTGEIVTSFGANVMRSLLVKFQMK